MKVQKRIEGKIPRPKWDIRLRLHAAAALSHYSMNKKLSGPQSQSERFGEEKNLLLKNKRPT